MSNAEPTPPVLEAAPQGAAAPKITQRHYQALAGLALAAVFLLRLQQGSGLQETALIVNLFVLMFGTISLLYRVRIAPILVPCALGLPMLFEQYNLNQFHFESRGMHVMDLGDVLLCVALLTYLVSMYRLNGLRFGLHPPDTRVPESTAARTETSLSPAELIGLVVPIPASALFAQVASLLLRQRWSLYDLPLRWQQFLIVAWTLLLVLFLAAHAFQCWRRLQMDRTTALLFLQDILWRETRGAQRSINRWIVWRKLRDRK
ncbi:MAG TPA: hypothetical protein VFE62_23235 [Gemmataceae bacterium]|nr:hypothetical protein [Gemmataceae bacterium]